VQTITRRIISEENTLRLGILGGTFDPIHYGHLRIAEEACDDMGLEKVLLIPGASPPHKVKKTVAPFEERFSMARLAAEVSPFLEAVDLEGRREGFSYSIDTLKEIRLAYGPGLELFFLIGIDAFQEIKSWKNYKGLFYETHFVVIERPGFSDEGLEALLSSMDLGFKRDGKNNLYESPLTGHCVIYKEMTLLSISSTMIRDLTAAGRSIRFLVPEPVRLYIKEKGLYLNGRS
jgi:nicotinate-nucleotide adenylyltransferase